MVLIFLSYIVFLYSDDLRGVCLNANGSHAGTVEIVKNVIEVAKKEQLECRILGTSLMTVSDAFPPLLTELHSKLGPIVRRAVGGGPPVSNELDKEESFVFQVLALLDKTSAAGDASLSLVKTSI